MEALIFFGVSFGILLFLSAIIAIPTYLQEKQKTKELHNEFINQFN